MIRSLLKGKVKVTPVTFIPERLTPVMSDSLQPHCYTVLGILQARILEWAPVPFCRGPSQHRDWTQISCIAGGFFSRSHQPGKPKNSGVSSLSLLQEIFPIQQSNRVSCIACETQETSWSILIQEPCNFINSFWGATTNRESYFVRGIQNGIQKEYILYLLAITVYWGLNVLNNCYKQSVYNSVKKISGPIS